jgi:hypothetical protein
MREARGAGRGSQTPKQAQSYAAGASQNAPAKRQGKKVLICRDFMGAAGFEPATSRV